MPRYVVTLTSDEIQELKVLIQTGGKGYRIRHAQILLKLDHKPEHEAWTYVRIKDAYGASRSTIAGIAQRFVMDGMEVYQRPYDPLCPVVCIDKTYKQLIKETRIPCEPGHLEKVDSVYIRNGVADIFIISEPLAGRRETVVTQTLTALDFADILRYGVSEGRKNSPCYR